ncbi:hypothetical protein RRG08_013462 [Elysia crispata]|uniref:Fibrinogen C-terminal domain-containing protein n=1 Tax=Elysia crispata TaxID=231223 RepID=A0AAE1AFU0_9GAST|nr:hypothetical protein RRG08_013462 [Elysia crispata]
MLEGSAETKGLELSMDRMLLPGEESDPCSQIVCRIHGNSFTVNNVTASRVKVNGDSSELLVVTTDAPEISISVGNIGANGTLKSNRATIYIDLADISSCDSDSIVCKVTFTNESGHRGETFTMAGPRKLPRFPAPPQADRENTVSVKESKFTPYKTGSPYLSELWFLGEKITKVEGKFETLSDRLDRRLSQNIDAVQSRAGTLENSVLERVSSVETDFSSRVSRLEDRVSSILLSESPDTSSDVAQSLADMERRLEDMRAELDQMNVSKTVSAESGHREKPVSCESGMAFDVSQVYPPYIILNQTLIDRQILCDTHTDGGGWIIFQRRTRGDVDFYRDWSSYKAGFGSLTGDFWLGNDAIHTLTDQHPYELRVDMLYEHQPNFAVYSSFRIEDEANKYRLRLGSFSGTAGTGKQDLSYQKDQYFSTFDRDNDPNSSSCAILFHGAWWYKDCHYSNLNGKWGVKANTGVWWYNGSRSLYPYFTEMKIRRVKRSDSG